MSVVKRLVQRAIALAAVAAALALHSQNGSSNQSVPAASSPWSEIGAWRLGEGR
jgi:hypothetical protein